MNATVNGERAGIARTIGRLANLLLRMARRISWLPPLLVRIFVGYLFYESGVPKIADVARFTRVFAGWGIAHPHLSVLLAGYSEVIGGLLLIAGLGTRLACIPLIVDMAVATLSVQIKGHTDFGDFVTLDDPLYLLSFFWLMVAGPGGVSLDYFVKRYIGPCFGVTTDDANRRV